MKASPRPATAPRYRARKALAVLALLAALLGIGSSSQPDSATTPTTAVNWTCRTNCLVVFPPS